MLLVYAAVCGLKLLVYAALSHQCIAARVCLSCSTCINYLEVQERLDGALIEPQWSLRALGCNGMYHCERGSITYLHAIEPGQGCMLTYADIC